MNKFSVIVLIEDMNLSFSIASVCNSYEYDLIFPDIMNLSKELCNKNSGVVIIDIENKKYFNDNRCHLIDEIKKLIKLPIIGISNEDSKKNEQRKMVDILLKKEDFLRNIKVILNQVEKGFGE